MRPNDNVLAEEVRIKLHSFQEFHPLPGIQNVQNLEALVFQIIDSIRRIKYIQVIVDKRDISKIYSDALNVSFDPLKAAIWHNRNGNSDEAFWLVFLSVHFGKNKNTGWQLTREIYSGLGHSDFWNWSRISSNPDDFCKWLNANQENLKNKGKFGNHRKYESLKVSGTGASVYSYVNWVLKDQNHNLLIENAKRQVGENPREVFNYLYSSLDAVERFGRTAKFDYLTMIGKLRLANIEPGSTFMHGATGPLRGARLLFSGGNNSSISISELDSLLVQLEAHLNLYFGMQVLEDALCNWQKNPQAYIAFKG